MSAAKKNPRKYRGGNPREYRGANPREYRGANPREYRGANPREYRGAAKRAQTLREEVYRANIELVDLGLVIATFGNVSGIDRKLGVIAIKPSGVGYADLTPANMVLLDLDGRRIEGDLNPSSDTKTHVRLYREFPEIGGVVHTHSKFATAWAQARLPLPCL
jgi:ribulose-5-phosphate 4-epimerase/fuculose-1-phosphate aldolase